MSAQPYRPEIDGLRAVAVGAVLLFHADVPGFEGGFLGVDIFFVISGYLITRNILADHDRGMFTLGGFYLRRARRLGPALFAAVFATLIFGAIVLTPEHMRGLGQSAVFATISASNLYFWLQAGYFDVSAANKPLLHTWSLGVEEQFYLVWPVALILLSRYGRRTRTWAIFGLGLASIVISEIRYGAHSAEVFFNFPYRIFEFSLGALVLQIETRLRDCPSILQNILAGSGLAVLMASILLMSETTRIPGFAALLPTLGAAGVIAAGDCRVSRTFLTVPVVVWLGLSSYSIYLFHWPIVAFYKYSIAASLSAIDMAIVCAASIGSGYLSYRFIESPFRNPVRRFGALRPARFILICVACASVLVGVGAHAWQSNGWEQRGPEGIGAGPASLPIMKSRLFERSIASQEEPFPVRGRPNAIVLGDSHAANLMNALVLAKSKLNLRHLHVQWMCQLYFGDRPFGSRLPIKTREEADRCHQQAEQLRGNSDMAAADFILISSTWSHDGLNGFEELLAYLKDTYRAEVILFGPRYYFIDPNELFKDFDSQSAANDRFNAAKQVERREAEARVLSAIASRNGIRFIEVQSFLCGGDVEGFCPLFSEQGNILYFDWHHWSPDGEALVGQGLRESALGSDLF